MTPEIQPRVRFFKFVLNISQPLRNIPGQAEETIAVSSVDSPVSAGRAGALDDPILDGIAEFLRLFVEGVADVVQLRQLPHSIHGFLFVADAQNTFQADNPPDP